MLFSWVEQRVLILARFSVILVLSDSLSFFLILSFFASWVESFIRLLRCFFGGQAETGFLFFVHQVFCIFFLVHALSCLCGERSQMISLVLLFCLEKRHAYLRNRRIRLHVQSVFESERKSVDVEKVMMIVVRIYLLEGWLETWFKQICWKREKLCHEMLKDWRLRFLELESCFMSPASSWLLALHLQLNESSWEMYDVEYAWCRVCVSSLSFNLHFQVKRVKKRHRLGHDGFNCSTQLNSLSLAFALLFRRRFSLFWLLLPQSTLISHFIRRWSSSRVYIFNWKKRRVREERSNLSCLSIPDYFSFWETTKWMSCRV